MAYDRNNIFAKILRGEAPCIRVYEDNQTLAFMDIRPQADGHTLIVPKTEAESIFDLDATTAASLIETTQKVARAIKKALKPAGVTLVQLNGSAAGQTVFHVHFHVIPLGGRSEYSLHGSGTTDATRLQEIAEMIGNAIE
jgi:histidine triad (HIT) family protein